LVCVLLTDICDRAAINLSVCLEQQTFFSLSPGWSANKRVGKVTRLSYPIQTPERPNYSKRYQSLVEYFILFEDFFQGSLEQVTRTVNEEAGVSERVGVFQFLNSDGTINQF
jgi:hypothetical protein